MRAQELLGVCLSGGSNALCLTALTALAPSMLAAATEQEAIEEAIAAIHGEDTTQDDAEGKIVALLADRAIDADAGQLYRLQWEYIHRPERRDTILRVDFPKTPTAGLTVDNAVNLPLQEQLLLAWWWEQSARQDHSIALGNALGGQTAPASRTVAAVILARSYASLQRFDDAWNWVNQARAFAGVAYDLPWLQTEVNRLQNDIHQLQGLAQLGYGYELYCQANAARIYGDPARAFDAFDHLRELAVDNAHNKPVQIVSLYDVQAERQPIQPIFAMAARYYAALCLADQGKARDAADYLAKYPSMPGDAYGGDAHLLLGEAWHGLPRAIPRAPIHAAECVPRRNHGGRLLQGAHLRCDAQARRTRHAYEGKVEVGQPGVV